MQPFKRGRLSSQAPETEEPLHRLLAGLVAAPLVEVSLLLAMCLVGGRGGVRLYLTLPAGFHAVIIGLAVALGLLVGFRGLLWLQGHLFYTHFEPARNWFTTATLWGIVIGFVWLSYLFAH